MPHILRSVADRLQIDTCLLALLTLGLLLALGAW